MKENFKFVILFKFLKNSPSARLFKEFVNTVNDGIRRRVWETNI